MDMNDRNYVAGLKSNIHACFESPQGKEVMKFLEHTCCWYRSVWSPDNPDMTLVNDGKRQVVATLKTIMELSPDQIVALAQQKES
jgi:hypothetical protein